MHHAQYNYYKVNCTKVNIELEKLDWDKEFRYNNVEIAKMKFAKKISKIIKDNVPVCKFSTGRQYMSWMKTDVLKAVKKRHFEKSTNIVKKKKRKL